MFKVWPTELKVALPRSPAGDHSPSLKPPAFLHSCCLQPHILFFWLTKQVAWRDNRARLLDWSKEFGSSKIRGCKVQERTRVGEGISFRQMSACHSKWTSGQLEQQSWVFSLKWENMACHRYFLPLPRAILGYGEFVLVRNSIEALIFYLGESLGRVGLMQGGDKENVS